MEFSIGGKQFFFGIYDEGIIRSAHEDYQLQSNIRISVSLKAEYVQT